LFILPGAAFTAYPKGNINAIFDYEICNCTLNKSDKFCARNGLQARYPVVTSFFIITHHVVNITLTIDGEESCCQVLNHCEITQSQPNNCSELHYTITSENKRMPSREKFTDIRWL